MATNHPSYTRQTIDHAARLICALNAIGDGHVDVIKTFVADFLRTLDKDVHLLGDGDFLEMYQDALKRRGKTKAAAAKAGK
jgi:hypothetical protein